MKRFRTALVLSCIFFGGIAAAVGVVSAEQAKIAAPAKQPVEPELTLEDQAALAALRDADRAKRRDPEWRSNTPPIEWIAIAYHGGVYDANFEPVEMTEAMIAAMQDSLLAILTKAAQGEFLKDSASADLLIAYANAKPSGYDGLARRNLVLEDMLDASGEAARARYLWRLLIVEREILLGAANARRRIDPSIMDSIRWRGRYFAPGDRYIEACRAKGVPAPPEFVFGSELWKRQGSLNYTFISVGRPTDVYAYKDESAATPGTCVALPRAATATKFSDGGPAELIGVICQANRAVDGAKHACFWDNLAQNQSGQVAGRLDGISQSLQFGFVTDGFSLVENCTVCHRGNNVFNIHPGTALDLSAAPATPERGGPYDVGGRTDWYRPIGRNWDDSRVPYGADKYANPPPAVLPALSVLALKRRERGCTDCHDIGSLDFDGGRNYCAVIGDAAHWTMPPRYARTRPREGTAGWPIANDPGVYRTHVEALATICRNVESDVMRVP